MHKGATSNLALRIAILALGVVGMSISGYLTVTHYQAASTLCLFGAKCDVVLTSRYAQVWDVPLSLFGLVLYLVITLLGLWLLLGKSEWEHLIALAVYGVALSGVISTGYLYYLEIFVLRAFCTWCIASSAVLVSIFILSLVNFVSIKTTLEQSSHLRRFKLSDYVRW